MLIGRAEEYSQLMDFYNSGRPELVVVYGRRRVGKTYLVRETFSNQFFFSFTGTTTIKTKAGHLERFAQTLKAYGALPDKKKRIKSWNEAFDILTDFIKSVDGGERKVIFLDEVPWLDTPNSGFMGAFEFFWNNFASARKDVLFIICGSAASWMSRKLFKNRGGLHNRTTGRILLAPLTLNECEAYLDAKGSGYERYDIIELYMVFGGIPFYLDLIDGRYSVPVNVDRALFAEGAPLANEFEELYASLFGTSQLYTDIVAALGTKKKGLVRDEILESLGIEDGGAVTEVLNNLELSGFIRRYYAFPQKKRGSLYQLIDNFSLFWLSFMKEGRPTSPRYWSSQVNTPRINSWRGQAFESVCLNHVDQIEQGLGISGVLTKVSSWQSQRGKKSKNSIEAAEQSAVGYKGAQIDLVIERADRIINICEVKYSQDELEIDAALAENLSNKMSAFKSETRTKKTVFLTMITTYGIKRNKHSGQIRAEVTMDALFLPTR